MREDLDSGVTEHKEASKTERDATIARITAQLAQERLKKVQAVQGHSAPTAKKTEQAAAPIPVTEKAAPAQQPVPTAMEEQKPAVIMAVPAPALAPQENKTSVLKKEISSADVIPEEKTVSVSKSVANHILHSSEGVHPFPAANDEKFREFFTTTAVVLPKEMQNTAAADEADAKAETEKAASGVKKLFGGFKGMFGLLGAKNEDEYEDEEEGVFFSEDVKPLQQPTKAPIVDAPEPVRTATPTATTDAAENALAQTIPELSLQEFEEELAPQKKKGLFSKMKTLFAASDEDEEDDEDFVFFPEEMAAQKVFGQAAPQTAVTDTVADETVQIDLFMMDKEKTIGIPPLTEAEQALVQPKEVPVQTAAARETLVSETPAKEVPAKKELPKGKISFGVPKETLAAQKAAVAVPKKEIEAAVVEVPVDQKLSMPEEDFSVSLVADVEVEPVNVAPVADVEVEPVNMAPAANVEEPIALEPVVEAAEEITPVVEQKENAEPIVLETLAKPVQEAKPVEEPATLVEEVQELASVTPQTSTETAVETATAQEPTEKELVAVSVQTLAEETTMPLRWSEEDEVEPEPTAEILFVDAAENIVPAMPIAQAQPAPEAYVAPQSSQEQPEVPEELELGGFQEEQEPALAAETLRALEHVGAAQESEQDDFFAPLAEELPEEPEPSAEAFRWNEDLEAPFEETPAHKYHQEPTQDLPEDQEGIAYGLEGMCAKLTLRLFATGVFGFALFLLGLMGQGVLPAIQAIDPIGAPVPFLLVNLVLLLICAGVSYPLFADGLLGLWKKPSPDTLPAIASIAALLQLVVCLMQYETFASTNVTLFSAMAGLLLFMHALGGRLMASVVQNNFKRVSDELPHVLAYRMTEKETVRTLTEGCEVEHPVLLTSRPVGQMNGFLAEAFAERESDRRAQWISYGLLAGAVLALLISLVQGGGAVGALSSFAGVICLGAPFSVTLISALPSLFLQRAAAQVGAMVPGWGAMQTLGRTNLITVDAKELFPTACIKVEGFKTFQKERIDLAILYATSILVGHCNVLSELFSGMVENRKEMLYEVKDLQERRGLGFIAWCENYRVILGTRELMAEEGVALPAMDYETRYSKNGERQVMYLAVSGQLYAMFLLRYTGERKIAKTLKMLRREQVRLVVDSQDPSLTARQIEKAYHLPHGFVTTLQKRQVAPLEEATAYRPQAKGVMLHLGHFVSFAGGLKAAISAANAEASASAVQLIAAAFSVLLSLFLSITGGLLEVALVALVLYQLAWGALSLAVIFTKKFE